MKHKKFIAPPPSVPFLFVIEELQFVGPRVRPMFGCYAVYVDDKIIFILRDREDFPEDNGVWMATDTQYHDSLRHEFPSMRSLALFGEGETKWQNLPMNSPDFEESVLRACELVINGDPRIGKVPSGRQMATEESSKPKKSKAKAKAKAKVKPKSKVKTKSKPKSKSKAKSKKTKK